MRKSMLIVVVVVSGLFTSGCAGFGQNLQCRPARWLKNHQECYDQAGNYHEFTSFERKGESYEQRKERRDLDRTIQYHQYWEEHEVKVRAHHAKQAFAACEEGRWDDLSDADAARCRELRANGTVK